MRFSLNFNILIKKENVSVRLPCYLHRQTDRQTGILGDRQIATNLGASSNVYLKFFSLFECEPRE